MNMYMPVSLNPNLGTITHKSTENCRRVDSINTKNVFGRIVEGCPTKKARRLLVLNYLLF